MADSVCKWETQMPNPKQIELPEWADKIEQDDHGTVATVTLSGVRFRMRWIEPGTFMMGSPEDEDGRHGDETRHQVTLTDGYWLAETQCTQELWQVVMGENPSRFRGEHRPVETVSWEDCQRFIRRANELAPGLGLRLPTEAEWEYACRAGTTGARYGELDDIAWHYENSGQTTHPVGQKAPNAWGLYDILGNVWEWCEDWYGEYPDVAVIDPKGADEGPYRVRRGGSWIYEALDARSAYRDASPPGRRDGFIGFRVARGPKPGEPSGERCESRRADAGGESGASSEAIELQESKKSHQSNQNPPAVFLGRSLGQTADWAQACKWLIAGKKVRRATWLPDVCWYTDRLFRLRAGNNNKSDYEVSFNPSNIFATDWSLLDE